MVQRWPACIQVSSRNPPVTRLASAGRSGPAREPAKEGCATWKPILSVQDRSDDFERPKGKGPARSRGEDRPEGAQDEAIGRVHGGKNSPMSDTWRLGEINACDEMGAAVTSPGASAPRASPRGHAESASIRHHRRPRRRRRRKEKGVALMVALPRPSSQ